MVSTLVVCSLVILGPMAIITFLSWVVWVEGQPPPVEEDLEPEAFDSVLPDDEDDVNPYRAY